MMKRVFVFLILCLVLIVSLFGCTPRNEQNDTLPGRTLAPMITQVPGGDQGAAGGAQGNQGPGSLGAS